MKVSYDPATDTLTVVFNQGVTVTESDEDRAGTILDYASDGSLVSIEILDATQHVTDARKIEYETISPDT
jgi:uncharacterized protein YuzE